jgi:glycosyl transferase, family 25
MEQAIPIFVISLARAALRRERIREHLDSLGLVYTLVDAVDGRKLASEELATLDASGGDLSLGLIGCYASHLNVYKAIIEQRLPLALILEDEARLNRRIAPLLQAGLRSTEFDYLFLDCEVYDDKGPVFFDASRPSDLGFGFTSFPLSAGPQATHALVITLDAAKRRLACGLPMRASIDVYSPLPQRFRFAAMLRPKGAYLGEDSLVSFTSSRELRTVRPWFPKLRRFPIMIALRDVMSPRYWRSGRVARKSVRDGRLPAGGQWRPLPAGRNIFEVSSAPLDQGWRAFTPDRPHFGGWMKEGLEPLSRVDFSLRKVMQMANDVAADFDVSEHPSAF